MTRSLMPMATPLEDLFRRFDRLLGLHEEVAPWTTSTEPGTRRPAMDLKEDPEGFLLRFELPGIKKENLDLDLEGRVVSLTARPEKIEEEGTWHREEVCRTRMRRVVELPEEVDVESAEARLEDGILSIRLRKVESKRARKIPIKD